ncbi:DUF1329 domain-containing protein [Massilia putida]|uniref:DUF1329 domain-containing protein n=1 Tax=Massilia putida TaxID=1141883 RepID=UPI000950CCE2|nr:DUF1329 domain-containing protein [Massilia putida]
MQHIVAALVMSALAAGAQAAVSPEEVKQLGSALTPWGAEKGASKDGTIPAYTGGLVKAPSNIQAAGGRLANPYADETPLFSIDARNYAQHAARLTAGAIELLKRYPDYRIDVYPTHRSFPEPPKAVQEASIRNAGNDQCKLSADGTGLRGCWGGVPFPIPKSGNEALWNHTARWRVTNEFAGELWLVHSGGETLLNQSRGYNEYPYYAEGVQPYQGPGQYYQRFQNTIVGPARDAGNVSMIFYPLEYDKLDQRTWSYTPGQRRVRLAPEFSYDTPSAPMGGAINYDEVGLFAGRADRFDFKLVGKTEKYVNANSYAIMFGAQRAAILGKQHLQPGAQRWELRRVWIVEAVRKPGARHSASKRVFYLDEDSWAIVEAEAYDNANRLYRVQHAFTAPDYTSGAFMTGSFFAAYDLPKQQYVAVFLMGTMPSGFYRTLAERRPEKSLTPESLAASGLR